MPRKPKDIEIYEEEEALTDAPPEEEQPVTLEELAQMAQDSPTDFYLPAGAKMKLPLPAANGKTVVQAQQEMQAQYQRDGKARCPCCDGHVEPYPFTMNFWSLEGLKFIVSEWRMLDPSPTAPKGIVMNTHPRLNPKILRDRNFAKLKHWGLLEKIGARRQKYIMWKPTQKGMDFVDGKISLPDTVLIYNDKGLAFMGRKIKVNEVKMPNDRQK